MENQDPYGLITLRKVKVLFEESVFYQDRLWSADTVVLVIPWPVGVVTGVGVGDMTHSTASPVLCHNSVVPHSTRCRLYSLSTSTSYNITLDGIRSTRLHRRARTEIITVFVRIAKDCFENS